MRGREGRRESGKRGRYIKSRQEVVAVSGDLSAGAESRQLPPWRQDVVSKVFSKC